MGLDAVEIVLRCEEVFGFRLEDNKVSQISTVGQLFELICAKLELPSGTTNLIQPGTIQLRQPLSIAPPLKPWIREDVWTTLIAVSCDQMSMEPDEIWYGARINADLGID